MSRPHAGEQARLLPEAGGEGLEGQRLASHLLARLRVEYIDPDELLRALLLAQDASEARLRGFCRRLQKGLERGADHAIE